MKNIQIYIHTYIHDQARFPSLVGLRLRAFGAKPPSEQGYYIKVYQGYYVTVTLTNRRPFQNRPTLDAKKMHFCSSESRVSKIFGISALKIIVSKIKTKLFWTCDWSIVSSMLMSRELFFPNSKNDTAIYQLELALWLLVAAGCYRPAPLSGQVFAA